MVLSEVGKVTDLNSVDSNALKRIAVTGYEGCGPPKDEGITRFGSHVPSHPLMVMVLLVSTRYLQPEAVQSLAAACAEPGVSNPRTTTSPSSLNAR
jgi:hypothetical protein